MRLINIALFLMIIGIVSMSLFTGSAIYKHDKENNITRDIYNYTESYLVWNESLFQTEEYNSSSHNISYNLFMRNVRINNIIFKIANTMGYSTFETAKLFIEIGYNSNGQYNLGYFLNLINVISILIIIGTLFYPAMFLGIGMYELYKYLRKRYLTKRKEKEEL